MKKLFKYIILCLFCLITTNVYALDDYSGGSSGSVGSLGSGKWTTQAVGIKVSSVSRSGVVKKSAIFLNNHGKSSYMFSSDQNPKMYQSTSISWVNGGSVPTYSLSFLPSKWTTGSGAINNLYDLLTKNNYTNLKHIAEVHFYYEFGNGDYLVIEPMTVIAGKYGTAFELANYYGLTSNCSDSSSFCWNYSGAVFRGSSTRPNGGVFYNTIYVSTPVLGLTTYSSSDYKARSNCFMSNTCGRGIGVFGYSEIYEEPPTPPTPPTLPRGLNVNVGCLSASITDRNFGTSGNTSCTTTVELHNNIGTSEFYAKTGRFLLRKEGNNVYINNNAYSQRPAINATNGIATATITKSCTISNSSTSSPNFTSSTYRRKPSFGLKFNNLEQTNSQASTPFKTSSLSSYSTRVTRRCSSCAARCYTEGGGSYCCRRRYYDCEWEHKYTYEQTYNFDYVLPSVYLDKVTGEAFDIRSSNTTGEIKGIISKFTDTNGVIPFNIVYDGTTYSPTTNACSYETQQDIVKITPGAGAGIDDSHDLQLEFRTIDTNSPFNRQTNSNWCGNNCSSNNTAVNAHIKTKPNSYGRIPSGGSTVSPIYTIDLRVDDIRYIKNYNQTHEYDHNDMSEVEDFITDMRNRRILR